MHSCIPVSSTAYSTMHSQHPSGHQGKLAMTYRTAILLVVLIVCFLSPTASAHSFSVPRQDKRDASTNMSGGNNNEGEAHGPIKPPSGSTFTSIPVGTKGEQIAAYWTKKPHDKHATQAFIMIHGKLRDGDAYWTTMDTVLQEAVGNNTQGADKNAIVVAPQFFSARYNSGQYSKDELAWGDVNAWQAGDPAVHPDGTTLTSFDALDALVQVFFNQTQYPSMQRVTVVGHGGGGQLNQRYATVADPATTTNNRIHIRFIHGDPSSCNYFTTDRPTSVPDSTKALPSKDSCPLYNTWRYGFDNFTGTASGLKKPQEYFSQYISRDVISMVGYQDVKASGDNYCMAQMQGGTKRRDRNLVWWQYINLLARTGEDLKGFPGTFDESSLPDWSGTTATPNAFGVRLIVVENAAHSAQQVFESDEGRAALFSTGTLPTGWRPQGWKNTTNAVMPNGIVTKLKTDNTSTAPAQKEDQRSGSQQTKVAALHTFSFIFASICTLAFSSILVQ